MGEALLVRRGGALGDVGIFIEPGLIVEFFGLSSNIPEGWLLCDGQNDTPNLIDKFIVGAGDTYAIDDTGGSANAIVPSHIHTASNTNTVGNHTHNIQEPINGSNKQVMPGNSPGRVNHDIALSGAHSHSATVSSTGQSATDANLPPYLGLFYIIKGEV